MSKTTIYKDTPLSAEHGIAYRNAMLQAAKNDTTLVLPSVMGSQSVVTVFEILDNVKKSGGYAQPKAPAKKAVFDAFVKAGLLQASGHGAKLQERLTTNPSIEMLYQVSKDHYAAIVFTKKGMAYVDPKGAACSNEPVNIETRDGPKKAPFDQILKMLWADFSGVSEAIRQEEKARGGTSETLEKRMQEETQKCCKVYTVEQQKDNFSSMDWCLTNLTILSEDIADTSGKLKSEEKIKRASIIDAIQGLKIPGDTGNRFELDYQDISQAKLKRQAWLLKTQAIERCSEEIAKEAEEEQTASPEAELSVRARVSIAKPQYRDIEPGKFEHHHSHNGTMVTNTIEIEASKEGKITGESKGGTATFYERFLKLARDFDTVCNRERPVVVLSMSRTDEGKRAFRDYFGAENVQFMDEGPESESSKGLLVEPGA